MELADIYKFKNFSIEKYEDMSLALLTVYSLYWLEEWQMPTSIETVSILNFKFFPEKFSMVGFSDYPDSLRTNRSLLQLGIKYKNLLTGSVKKGFFLNVKGKREAEGLIKLIGLPKINGKIGQKVKIKGDKNSKNKKEKARTTFDPIAIVMKVKNSNLFRLYIDGKFDDSQIIHLLGLLDIYENTPKDEKERKIKEIEIVANQLKEKDIKKFLEQIKKKFKNFLKKN